MARLHITLAGKRWRSAKPLPGNGSSGKDWSSIHSKSFGFLATARLLLLGLRDLHTSRLRRSEKNYHNAVYTTSTSLFIMYTIL